jgi:transposase InsO family protein
MALAERQPAPGCIHHSDQGVQYASHEYIKELKHYGFLISMARTGNPYENAQVESFFKTLKYEEVNLWNYQTLADVVARVRISFRRCTIQSVFTHQSDMYLLKSLKHQLLVSKNQIQNLSSCQL